METFIAWRHAAYDTPVRTMPSRRLGRYNTPLSAPTQYLSLHPWGPWAEFLRWEDRRAEEDVLEVRSRVWALRVDVAGPVLRVGFDNATSHGMAADDLVGDDYTPCQELARRSRELGVAALVVPSAALPGTENLVLLGPRVASPWATSPLDEVDVPAAVTADRAGPPLSVVPYVRWRRTAHAGLAAWRDGTAAPFLETVPTPL